MEDIYKNRLKLYQFLIDEYGLNKVEEIYDPENFGNFVITLSADDFLLSYIYDRSYLTIKIASKLEAQRAIDLSFVRDFIYDPENINSEDEKDNLERIEELNTFLREDFVRISSLFSTSNYTNTRNKIDALLKERFNKRFP